MGTKLMDNPLILSILFHPRPARPGGNPREGVHDGTIPVAEGIELGYRLYAHTPDAPVILYFHGNGEIAPDYDDIAPEYHRAGASLLVVDYRGYGWSSGDPLASALLPDAEKVAEAVPDILKAAGLAGESLLVMGRSLGSAPAIHLAHEHPGRFKGLIVESGFAHTIPLLARLGLPVNKLVGPPDPLGNARKMEAIHLPLLVIHGDRDTLIPFENGETLYRVSPAVYKHMTRIQGAGHNDLLYYGIDAYFSAIENFIKDL
jgi:pimeloyl-ACP methyl ester carboxylesterase